MAGFSGVQLKPVPVLDSHEEFQAIRGIVTVLNTPFRADGSIDIDGLRANVDYARLAGVAGFLVNGLAAEVDHLNAAERESILRNVADTAGDVPVIAGLGNASDPDVPRVADRYTSFGATGLLVNGAGVSSEELPRVLLELDHLQPAFLMLQDWDATGSGIPVDTLLRLVDRIPSLHWLKIEVVPAGPKYSELIARGPAHLCVAGGWAVREMIDALERGVHAFMPTALHHTYVRIYNLFTSGRGDEARELFERLRPILDFSNQRLDISIAFFKRLLQAQGIYATGLCREPAAKLDAALEGEADALISRAISLEEMPPR